MSFEARDIRQEEREACLDLWCTIWPGDSRPYFQRYFYGDVEWLPYYTQVGFLDGKMVSAVQVCKRTVACGDFLLTMGGIANVVTLPEYRGHGYNTACLKRAIAVMEADAMDFSLLWTGINGFYARLGFATLPWPGLQGTVRSGFTPRPTVYTIRPATAEDLPAIRAVYAQYNRRRPIAVQRSEAYWRDWVGISPQKIPGDPSGRLLVAEGGNHSIAGYVWFHEDEDHTSVRELGVSAADLWMAGEDPTIALLEAAAGNALENGRPELHLDIAPEPVVLGALSTLLNALQRPVGTGSMVRLLHRENLLKSITMGLNDRWIAAGRPHGALAFQTPYGPIRLDANGAFLQVEPVPEGTPALPQETLFGLLFGMLSPEQATGDTMLHPLLSALFPPAAPVYWPADGF